MGKRETNQLRALGLRVDTVERHVAAVEKRRTEATAAPAPDAARPPTAAEQAAAWTRLIGRCS